ncbi:nitroreductase/quinone reductase family protein [Amycolatopsis sp. NPDC005961]|uniref:nitroreductase/quinone reductase family protein n=1 Tax=Amycolatopsis sp. NPDC005961 TaxID=3156720 RepID=UPI0033E55A55
MVKAPSSSSPWWTIQRRLARLNKALFSATRGRVGATDFGAPVLLLDHVGRRTGQARTNPLIYLDDAPNLVVVGSKGGTDAHPHWFHNLMAMDSTEVELPGGVRRRVRPRLADGTERDALWSRLVALYRPYATYANRTDRRIPVIVLEPAPGNSGSSASHH